MFGLRCSRVRKFLRQGLQGLHLALASWVWVGVGYVQKDLQKPLPGKEILVWQWKSFDQSGHFCALGLDLKIGSSNILLPYFLMWVLLTHLRQLEAIPQHPRQFLLVLIHKDSLHACTVQPRAPLDSPKRHWLYSCHEPADDQKPDSAANLATTHWDLRDDVALRFVLFSEQLQDIQCLMLIMMFDDDSWAWFARKIMWAQNIIYNNYGTRLAQSVPRVGLWGYTLGEGWPSSAYACQFASSLRGYQPSID